MTCQQHSSITRPFFLRYSLTFVGEFSRDEADSRITNAFISQPLTTAIQIGLVNLFASWNIKPTRVTGHSSGEIAAAYCAGALTHRAAIAIAYYRGQVALKVRRSRDGAMLAVGLSEEETNSFLMKLRRGRAKVACVNSPSNVTVSGDRSAVSELSAIFQAQGVFVRKLAVDVAYHSHHMKDVADEYCAALAPFSATGECRIDFHSSVHGMCVPASDLDSDYWVSNMVEPVRFSCSVRSLLQHQSPETAIGTLLEIGPHSALQGSLKQILQSFPGKKASHIRYGSALKRNANSIHTCQALAVQLLESGCPIDLSAVNFPYNFQAKKVLVDLPPYSWDHSISYWAETAKASRENYPRSDILGVMAKDSVSTGFRWRNIVRRTEIPWINDHAVQSNTIYPAAGFLSMAIEAECQHKALRRKPIKGYQLREVVIGYAMVLSPDIENVETAVSLRPHNESRLVSSNLWDEFSISSSNDGDTWTEHCRGLIRVEDDGQTNEVDGGRQLREESEQYRSMPSDFENECTTIIDVEEMYEGLGQLGLGFGPTFTNLQIAHASQDKCFAQVSIPNTAAKMPLHFEYSYVIHPATLDSFVQAVFAIGGQYKHRHHGTPVPTFVQELYVSQSIDRSPGHILDVYAQIDPQDVRPHATFSPKGGKKSLIVLDRSRSSYGPEVSIQGLEFSYLALNTQEEGRNNGYKMNYQINWQPDPSFLCWVQAPEISKMFRFPCPDDNQIIASQQTAFYYAERAVSAVSPEEVSTKQPHLQKLYAALVRFCKIIRNKQLGSLQTNDWLQLSSEDRAIVCARVGQSPGGTLLHPVGENLPRILRGEIEPLSVMMEDNRLERYCRTYGPVKQSYKQAAAVIKLLGNKNPQLKILALGASAGGATFSILEALSGGGNAAPNFTKYDFTDPYPTPFENATAMLSRWSSLITFRKLDIECDPIQQGYRPSSYDLIVAANEVHTIGWTENALKNVRSLLKPGGTLILIEITLETIVASLTFGTLPGWWSGQSWSHTRKNIPPSQPQTAEEPNPVSGPLLSDAQWDSLLHATGFTGENAVLWDTPDVASHQISTFIATLPLKHREAIPAVTIVLNTDRFEPCASQLRSLLSKEGIKCNLANLPECAPKDRISIVLYELTGSVLRNPSPSNFEGIKRIFLDSSGVLWVTEGGLIECSNPDLNLVIGIARTIRAEKGDTMITTLDLDAQNPLSPAARAAKIFSVFTANFRKEVATSDIELEYAERNGVVMIPRLVEDNRFSSPETSAIGSTSLGSQPFNRDGRPLRAEIGTPGLLDSIQFVADDRISGELSENDVEVNIKASGINFRDVMTALGQISSYPLGCECSGIVSAVGKSVHDFQLGDRVIATVKDGCFCSSVRTTAYAVEKIPDDIPFEVAATFPISYFTAYWATFKVARLRKDETILVHAGSGGVGQALINLSQLIGAKVFATVGNLEKKRLLVDRYHIPDCNIFSSRDSTFAKGIMRATKGRGVDVIMNSLSGDALRLTWNCIAPFGRFVELGKRDFTVNSHLEMRCFEKNVSFTGLDVPLDSHHAEKRKIWAKIMRLHRNGSIKAPWPITVFGISEVEKALRIMQSGKHMGKIVLMPQPGEMVKVVRSKMNDRILRDDVSYLLVGGLGGIGRATARWMFQHGAKNFIFASRSGSDKEASQETISVLRNKGAQVAVFKCDISNLDDLKRVLRESRENMPPIRGLIHGTFVLKVDIFPIFVGFAVLT